MKTLFISNLNVIQWSLALFAIAFAVSAVVLIIVTMPKYNEQR